MRKFYENPSMTVKKFGEENVVTVSGKLYNGKIDDDGITELKESYTVGTISAAKVVF